MKSVSLPNDTNHLISSRFEPTRTTFKHFFANSNFSHPTLRNESNHLPSCLYSSCFPSAHEENILPDFEDDFPLPKLLKKYWDPIKPKVHLYKNYQSLPSKMILSSHQVLSTTLVALTL